MMVVMSFFLPDPFAKRTKARSTRHSQQNTGIPPESRVLVSPFVCLSKMVMLLIILLLDKLIRGLKSEEWDKHLLHFAPTAEVTHCL
jgi:hypothetical protein